jgi:hypothetical protein
MSQSTEQREGAGVAEGRAQKDLTDRVAVRLERPSKSGNLKWGTWRGRFGLRGKA